MESTESNSGQCGDQVDVKPKLEIKEEPDDGIVVVISSLSRHNDSMVPEDRNEVYDFSSLDLVKEEIDTKDEIKSMAKEGAANEQCPGSCGKAPSNKDLQIDSASKPTKGLKNKKRQGHVAQKTSKQHKCETCGFVAKYKSKLTTHLRKHTGEKPYGCDHCDKRFQTKQHLQSHMKVHVAEFLFHCHGCLKGFDAEDEKKEHDKDCKIKRYECHICEESFGSMKANLTRHMTVHSGAKPFECKECFKTFTRKGSLRQHMKCHAGSRALHCSRCRRAFFHENKRNAHEIKCNRKVYECYICSKLHNYRIIVNFPVIWSQHFFPMKTNNEE
ncbi:zinc finger protein 33B-like [Contarinia nasturtii]|uniref:zinc finger protein 33B-like n=1 Tax=Contarinia nasturtii TaxID=265458 RepID=UPI0012D43473|nr:zinc finger protein 33B-like [Contarinia nasturtii]